MLKVKLVPPRECTLNGQKFRAFHFGDLHRWDGEQWKEVICIQNDLQGYCQIPAGDKFYRYHRIIYHAFNPDWDIEDRTSLIGHLDADKCNNAIANLFPVIKKEKVSRGWFNNRKYDLPKYISITHRRGKWYWVIQVTLDNRLRKTQTILGGEGEIPKPLPIVPDAVMKARDDFVKLHKGFNELSSNDTISQSDS